MFNAGKAMTDIPHRDDVAVKAESYAPVKARAHEFRILYSTRVAQRDKKWADGLARLYEYNGRFIVLNGDQVVLAADFFPSKTCAQILLSILVAGRVFKLPSHNLMVEIVEKNGVVYPVDDYERHEHESKTGMVKHDPDLCSALQQRRRTVGLIRRKNETPRPSDLIAENLTHRGACAALKTLMGGVETNGASETTLHSPSGVNGNNKEPGVSPSDSTLQLEQHLATQIESLVSTYKPNQGQKKPLISPKSTPGHFASTLKARPRILPRSTRCFKYLTGSEPALVPRNQITRIRVSCENIATSPVTVKPEPLVILQKKGLDDADIIYDLSDYEEDQRFYNLVKARNDSAESEQSPPIDQSQDIAHEASLASKEFKQGEAHDPELDLFSDFDI